VLVRGRARRHDAQAEQDRSADHQRALACLQLVSVVSAGPMHFIHQRVRTVCHSVGRCRFGPAYHLFSLETMQQQCVARRAQHFASQEAQVLVEKIQTKASEALRPHIEITIIWNQQSNKHALFFI